MQTTLENVGLRPGRREILVLTYGQPGTVTTVLGLAAAPVGKAIRAGVNFACVAHNGVVHTKSTESDLLLAGHWPRHRVPILPQPKEAEVPILMRIGVTPRGLLHTTQYAGWLWDDSREVFKAHGLPWINFEREGIDSPLRQALAKWITRWGFTLPEPQGFQKYREYMTDPRVATLLYLEQDYAIQQHRRELLKVWNPEGDERLKPGMSIAWMDRAAQREKALKEGRRHFAVLQPNGRWSFHKIRQLTVAEALAEPPLPMPPQEVERTMVVEPGKDRPGLSLVIGGETDETLEEVVEVEPEFWAKTSGKRPWQFSLRPFLPHEIRDFRNRDWWGPVERQLRTRKLEVREDHEVRALEKKIRGYTPPGIDPETGERGPSVWFVRGTGKKPTTLGKFKVVAVKSPTPKVEPYRPKAKERLGAKRTEFRQAGQNRFAKAVRKDSSGKKDTAAAKAAVLDMF